MCEASAACGPTVVMEEVGTCGGSGVTVVDEGMVTRKVVGNVEHKLGIDCDPGDTGQRHEGECVAEQDFVVPPNSALWKE